MTTAAPTQRELLAARQLPTEPVSFPADPATYAAATRELAAALLQAREQPRSTEAQDRVLAARAAIDAQPAVTFVVRCIPPPEYEALVALHPATEAQAAKGQDVNLAEFRPAILAACVTPPDGQPAYTAEDWQTFARDGRVSFGEQTLLVSTAVALNTRSVQVAAGKG